MSKKLKIGDKVKVISRGENYPSHKVVFREMRFKNTELNDFMSSTFSDDCVFTVEAIAPHHNKSVKLVKIVSDSGIEFLFGSSGLKKVEDPKKPLAPEKLQKICAKIGYPYVFLQPVTGNWVTSTKKPEIGLDGWINTLSGANWTRLNVEVEYSGDWRYSLRGPKEIKKEFWVKHSGLSHPDEPYDIFVGLSNMYRLKFKDSPNDKTANIVYSDDFLFEEQYCYSIDQGKTWNLIPENFRETILVKEGFIK